MFDPFWSRWASDDNSVCVVTPGGGWHVYLRVPDGTDASLQRQPDWIKGRINIRAGRGYVVAPWCQTRSEADDQASTGEYRLARDAAEIPFAPPELVEHCKPLEHGTPADPDGGSSRDSALGQTADDGFPVEPGARLAAIAQTDRILDRLRSAAPGTRNNTLNATALEFGKLVASGAIEKGTAHALLATAAAECGLSPDEIRATVRSGLNAGLVSGERVPRSALDALLMAPVPIVDRATVWRPTPAVSPMTEHTVERLMIEGCVTVLSGQSGTGKTTIGASLMAAATAGLRNFSVERFGVAHSDIGIREACWVCVSYEGGQYMQMHKDAWHKGLALPMQFPDRQMVLNFRSPLVFTDAKRNTLLDKVQLDTICRMIDQMRRAHPILPVNLLVDNISSAVEDSTDPTQGSAFMRQMRGLAETNIAVLLLAHPPKRGGSAVYGSHVLFSFADIVGSLEVLRQDGGEWTQWIDFDKHRAGSRYRSLELRSRKLGEPIMMLPPDWGGDPRVRTRALDDLRVPFIFQICVRNSSEKEAAKNRVAVVVREKPSVEIPIVAPGNIVDFVPRR